MKFQFGKNRWSDLVFVIITFLTVAFCLLAVNHKALGADIDLAWDANTESDLAGYKLHYGIYIPGQTVNFTDTLDAGNQTNFTISGLIENTTYVFAATAYDTDGNVSAYSDKIVYTPMAKSKIITIPGRPKTLTIQFE